MSFEGKFDAPNVSVSRMTQRKRTGVLRRQRTHARHHTIASPTKIYEYIVIVRLSHSERIDRDTLTFMVRVAVNITD